MSDKNATYFKRKRQTGKHFLKIQSFILVSNTSDLVLLGLAVLFLLLKSHFVGSF